MLFFSQLNRNILRVTRRLAANAAVQLFKTFVEMVYVLWKERERESTRENEFERHSEKEMSNEEHGRQRTALRVTIKLRASLLHTSIPGVGSCSIGSGCKPSSSCCLRRPSRRNCRRDASARFCSACSVAACTAVTFAAKTRKVSIERSRRFLCHCQGGRFSTFC